jgi:hypothetical protein
LGNACGIVPGTAAAIKMATFLGAFVIVVCLPVALAAAGVIRKEQLPNGGV